MATLSIGSTGLGLDILCGNAESATRPWIGLLMGRAGPDFDLWMAHPPGSGPDFV